MITMKIHNDEDIGEYIKITHSSVNYKDIWEEITLRIPRAEFEFELKKMMEDYNERRTKSNN